MTIDFEAVEFATVDEAVQHTFASRRGFAIRLRGQLLVVADEFALCDRRRSTSVGRTK